MQRSLFDDNSSLFHYSDQWAITSNPHELGSSSHTASVPGPQVRVGPFQGSRISVYGTVGPSPATVHYLMDSTMSVDVKALFNGTTVIDQLLYTSAALDPTRTHTLVMNVLDPGTFSLDFVAIDNATGPVVTQQSVFEVTSIVFSSILPKSTTSTPTRATSSTIHSNTTTAATHSWTTRSSSPSFSTTVKSAPSFSTSAISSQTLSFSPSPDLPKATQSISPLLSTNSSFSRILTITALIIVTVAGLVSYILWRYRRAYFREPKPKPIIKKTKYPFQRRSAASLAPILPQHVVVKSEPQPENEDAERQQSVLDIAFRPPSGNTIMTQATTGETPQRSPFLVVSRPTSNFLTPDPPPGLSRLSSTFPSRF